MPRTQMTLRALEDYIFPTATYTLTSQIALQKLFNASTNGAVTVDAGATYFFECSFDLSAMSATSGNFGFGFLGTATLNSVRYTSTAQKAGAIGTPFASQITVGGVATATVLVTASIITTGTAIIQGIIRINSAGTLIPAVSLGVAAPAIVGLNSYFRLVHIGTNIQTNSGPWT